MFSTMACETFNQDLEMINAGCCSSDSPLNTQFLLSAFGEKKLCPRFYGKKVQERFFAQLVNVYDKEPEVPQYQKQFLDNVKQLGSQIRSVNF